MVMINFTRFVYADVCGLSLCSMSSFDIISFPWTVLCRSRDQSGQSFYSSTFVLYA